MRTEHVMMQLNIQNESYLSLLVSYLLYNRVVPESEFEFTSQAEYSDYLKLNPPVTINNEKVKSYGEMEIANYLAQNGIRYNYEMPYKIDTRTAQLFYAQIGQEIMGTGLCWGRFDASGCYQII